MSACNIYYPTEVINRSNLYTSPEQRKLGVMKWSRNNSIPSTQWKSVLQKLQMTEDSTMSVWSRSCTQCSEFLQRVFIIQHSSLLLTVNTNYLSMHKDNKHWSENLWDAIRFQLQVLIMAPWIALWKGSQGFWKKE